jgi:tetratricopeptide (TPR) repeat protein
MDRRHRYWLKAAVATIAVGFTICSAAAEPEDALTASGDAAFKANQYAAAEAAYAEALQLAEQQGGPDSERVLAPLRGLGNTLAASGHHHEAVPRLQRALAIERAKFGLFDVRQQDTLKTLADSLTALDRKPEAQDLMIYRVRVAEKAYGEGDVKVVSPMCDLGDWFAETGKTPEARMTFGVALNIVTSKRSSHDLLIVEPLRGIARAYMRRQSYPEAWLYPPSSPACSAPGSAQGQECVVHRMDAGGKRIAGARKLGPEGERALQQALRIVEADLGASNQARIETLIQMGDWYQIKKSPREALSYYQRALQLIGTTPGLAGSADTRLDVPVRLYYPTPQIVANTPATQETQSHYVQLEFTVAADGSVAAARVVDHDTRDRYVDDILDAMRDARFRPKFVDGQAVATPGMSYREVFWTTKSRT